MRRVLNIVRGKDAKPDPRIDDSKTNPLAPSSPDPPPTPSIQALFPQSKIYGLRVLHTPLDPVVDIVLLHGLNGRPDKTFLHKETGIYWPVHLLIRDIPHGRILTFGYDADVAKLLEPVGQNTLEDHASNLVNDLARVRAEVASVRPLHL
jgi:hypothetical protein